MEHHDDTKSSPLLDENASLTKVMITAVSLGVVHILTGLDLLSGLSWRAFSLGVQWGGGGHSLGIVSVAVVLLAVGHAVNLGVFRVVCNYLAGGLLILIGRWTLYHAKKEYEVQTKLVSKWSNVECQDASYTLTTSDDARSVGVLSDFFWANHSEFVSGKGQTLASVAVGLVHGIAGPGGVLGVLPVLAMYRTLHAIAYLGCFCASSILCMGVLAACYGQLTHWCASRSTSANTQRASVNYPDDEMYTSPASASKASAALIAFRIAMVSSLLSIVVGIAWIVLQACGVLDQVIGRSPLSYPLTHLLRTYLPLAACLLLARLVRHTLTLAKHFVERAGGHEDDPEDADEERHAGREDADAVERRVREAAHAARDLAVDRREHAHDEDRRDAERAQVRRRLRPVVQDHRWQNAEDPTRSGESVHRAVRKRRELLGRRVLDVGLAPTEAPLLRGSRSCIAAGTIRVSVAVTVSVRVEVRVWSVVAVEPVLVDHVLKLGSAQRGRLKRRSRGRRRCCFRLQVVALLQLLLLHFGAQLPVVTQTPEPQTDHEEADHEVAVRAKGLDVQLLVERQERGRDDDEPRRVAAAPAHAQLRRAPGRAGAEHDERAQVVRSREHVHHTHEQPRADDRRDRRAFERSHRRLAHCLFALACTCVACAQGRSCRIQFDSTRWRPSAKPQPVSRRLHTLAEDRVERVRGHEDDPEDADEERHARREDADAVEQRLGELAQTTRDLAVRRCEHAHDEDRRDAEREQVRRRLRPVVQDHRRQDAEHASGSRESMRDTVRERREVLRVRVLDVGRRRDALAEAALLGHERLVERVLVEHRQVASSGVLRHARRYVHHIRRPLRRGRRGPVVTTAVVDAGPLHAGELVHELLLVELLAHPPVVAQTPEPERDHEEAHDEVAVRAERVDVEPLVERQEDRGDDDESRRVAKPPAHAERRGPPGRAGAEHDERTQVVRSRDHVHHAEQQPRADDRGDRRAFEVVVHFAHVGC